MPNLRRATIAILFGSAMSFGLPATSLAGEFYIGVGAVQSFATVDVDARQVGLTGTVTGDRGKSPRAVYGLVYLGYGGMVGPIYLGGELESWIGKNETSVGFFQASGSLVEASVTYKQSFGASLRIGYPVRENILVYGRVGGLATRFEGRVRQAGVKVGSGAAYVPGLAVGGGAEATFAKNFVLRLEYRYTRYQTFKRTVPGFAARTVRFKVDAASSNILLGIAYKFTN